MREITLGTPEVQQMAGTVPPRPKPVVMILADLDRATMMMTKGKEVVSSIPASKSFD